jgi:SAM-dependent methyltransferase
MYDKRLADVYDVVYRARKDYAAEAALITRLAREHNPAAATLLDVACGTGEHLRYLRDHFTEVVGVDISAEMLVTAAGKLPGVALYEADMRGFDLGRRFDVVCCLFSAIGYMRDVAELNLAAARLAAHVDRGGLLVVEPWVTEDAWLEGHVGHDVATADGRTVVRVIHSSRKGRTSRLVMHYLVGDARGVRHFVDRHDLTLFTWDEYGEAFRATGCRVTVRPDGPSGRGLILAAR